VVSHGCGWAAWADAPAKNSAAAPAVAINLALAGNFLIALFISRFLAIARKNIEQCRNGNPGQSQAGSNHTLFPSARKERTKPCGIFARSPKGMAGRDEAMQRTVAIRANLLWKSAELPGIGASRRRSRPLLGPGAA